MPLIDLPDISLNYELDGDGDTTIVLVNGLADDLGTWVFQKAPFVAAGYRVLSFDNRGVGRSAQPAGPYSSAMLAADAKALVDELGISGFHLMGVSMGGMIAQEYALAYPGDLRSATFACTYAAPGPFCSRLFALWREMAPVMGVPAVMRDVTLWAFTQEFFRDRAEELAEFETGMAFMNMPTPAYLAQLSIITEHDTRDRLGHLEVPTLVLAGAEDILIPVELSQELHTLIPDAKWRTTAGGHGCMWEHPEEFNTAYLDFLASLQSSTL